MNQLSLPVILLVLFAVSACSPKKPISYNSNKSKAFNTAQAANMEYGLKDVEVPKDTVADFRHSKAFGLAYGLAGYNSPMPGLSASGSAGMNLLAWALLPESPSARNSVFAWMPASIGGKSKEAALNTLADLIIEASEKAAVDLGYLPKTFIGKKGTDKRGFAVTLTNDLSEHCKVADAADSTVSYCNIVYKVRYPREVHNTPGYIGSDTSWFFDPVESGFSAPIFNDKRGFQYNQLELLTAVSKYLPDWVYIYLAPGQVQMTETAILKVPLILNRGEPLYFIKPENS